MERLSLPLGPPELPTLPAVASVALRANWPSDSLGLGFLRSSDAGSEPVAASSPALLEVEPVRPPLWKPGLVAGDYLLGRLLGSGGMAEVWMAWPTGRVGGAKLALKRVRPDLVKNGRFIGMFCDEARTLALLAHPNIVELLDFVVLHGEPVMVLEYVQGVSLSELLKRSVARGTKVPIAAALFVVHELLCALDCVHGTCDAEGRPLRIVHRDISPGNLLISWEGEVKLTDFGIVRSELVDDRTSPGLLKGKLGYMSPEQIVGAELDCRSDLFAAGTILAELLLGMPLFSGREELEVLLSMYEAHAPALGSRPLPQRIEQLVRIALERDAKARYQNAAEFAEAIRVVAESEGLALAPASVLAWLSDVELIELESAAQPIGIARQRASADDIARRLGRVQQAWELFHDDLPFAAEIGKNQRSESASVPASCRGLAYRVRQLDGRLSATLSLGELAAAVATGRVQRDDELEAGGRALGLADVSELARLLSCGAYADHGPIEERALWQRPFERARLPAVLFELARSRASGLLLARDGTNQKRIYFEAGLPCFAASTLSRELLGSWLVDRGWLSHAELERALDHALARRSHLGEALVACGVLRPPIVLRSLVAQLETRFMELGAWSVGQIAFVPEERPGLFVPRPLRRPAELITMLIRRSYSDTELAALLDEFEGSAVSSAESAAFGLNELGLGFGERQTLERISGARPLESVVRELAQQRFATEAELRRALLTGIWSGVLRLQ